MMLPAPRLTATAWLLKPIQNVGPEADAELRQTLLRRLGAIVVSAALTLCISAVISFHHRQTALLCWTASDAVLAGIRIPLLLYIMGSARQVRGARRLHPWIVDLFVGVGTLWSALLGVGGLLCILTDDPGATILSAVLVTGTIGAQGVRSPGSPRLNIFQMCLVVVPFGIGVSFSTIPLAGWVAPIIPLYLFSMVSITLQLHDDYVKLIVARIENRQRALHCPLTGLPNRAFFGEGLAEALETAEAGFGAVTVMYLDLDGFKAVNDRFGHRAGDDVLRQVADRLRGWKHLRATVARLGGDEFAVLIRADLDDLEASVRRLIETLSLPYDIGADGSASIGVSVGLATSETGADAADLLMRADQALYAAKRAGKGTFRWHGGAEETAHGQPSTIDLNGMLRRMRGVQERAISPAHT